VHRVWRPWSNSLILALGRRRPGVIRAHLATDPYKISANLRPAVARHRRRLAHVCCRASISMTNALEEGALEELSLQTTIWHSLTRGSITRRRITSRITFAGAWHALNWRDSHEMQDRPVQTGLSQRVATSWHGVDGPASACIGWSSLGGQSGREHCEVDVVEWVRYFTRHGVPRPAKECLISSRAPQPQGLPRHPRWRSRQGPHGTSQGSSRTSGGRPQPHTPGAAPHTNLPRSSTPNGFPAERSTIKYMQCRHTNTKTYDLRKGQLSLGDCGRTLHKHCYLATRRHLGRGGRRRRCSRCTQVIRPSGRGGEKNARWATRPEHPNWRGGSDSGGTTSSGRLGTVCTLRGGARSAPCAAQRLPTLFGRCHAAGVGIVVLLLVFPVEFRLWCVWSAPVPRPMFATTDALLW